MAEHGVFAPYGFALFLLAQMKPLASYLEDPLRSGVVDIPGLKDFLKSAKFERTYGGTPVIVLEDVNITLSPRQQTMPEMDQVNLWKGELGKAGVFFDTLITQGHESGVIVFVTTRSVALATFFSIFNAQQKSCTFKPLTSRADLKCQLFNWSKEERIKFLTLQNSLKKPGERIDAIRIEAIVDDSMAGTTPLDIRRITANFDDECATAFPIPAASMSIEERLPSWMQCGCFSC